MVKLLSVKPSTRPDKKLMATFDDGTVTHFGAKGMNDYTLTGDKEARDRYRARHKKDLETRDPKRAGFLSFYILWGDSTSRQQNIRDYKNRFNL
jgi:hypothetical protein